MRELRRWLPLLVSRPRPLAAGIGLLLLTVLAATGLLALSGWFISAAAVTGLLLAAGVDARLGVFIPGAGIRALAVTRTLARYGERLVNHDAVLRILSGIRVRVFDALARLDPATLARFRYGETLNRLTADVDALDNLYLRALVPPAVAALALAAVVAGLAWFAPAAAAGAALVLMATLVLTVGMALHAGARPGEALARAQEGLRRQVLDLAAGLAELRCFGALERTREEIGRQDAALVDAGARLARRSAAAETAMQLGVQLAAVAALAVGVALHASGTLAGPLVALLPLAVLGLGEILPAVPAALVELGRTRAAARRLNEQVDRRPAVVEPEAPAARPETGEITLEEVSIAHGAGSERVLDAVSLAIGAGEVVAVCGPSGAGKSTLGDLVGRVLDPDAGRVCLGGVPLDRLRREDIAAKVGYLTQRAELFADTLAANLRVARPDASEEALWAALEVAALDDFVRRRPDGLAAWLGESGVRLSGGQARRLALARVVLADCPVVVIDEPFEGLDRATATRLATRLERWLAAGRTALLLAHDPAGLPRADRVLWLEGGRLVAQSEGWESGEETAGAGRLEEGDAMWRNAAGTSEE
jgi:ATP-binding cassette subfamily C protein CydC